MPELHRRRSRHGSLVERIATGTIPQTQRNSIMEGPGRRSQSAGPATVARVVVDELHPFSSAERDHLWQTRVEGLASEIVMDERLYLPQMEADHAAYTAFARTAAAEAAHCGQLLAQTNAVRAELRSLTTKYDQVASETRQFQGLARALIDSHLALTHIHATMRTNLAHFEALDSLTKTLNNPHGGILVHKRSFRDALVRLDECLAFVAAHPAFKEVELYEARFRQCMTRALTVIRSYLLLELKTLGSDVGQRVLQVAARDKAWNGVTVDALLYTKFGEHADGFADLVGEISTRVRLHPEYNGLLCECRDQYTRVRLQLLHPVVWNHLDTSVLKRKALVQFAQDNLSFFTKMIEAEAGLYRRFFSGPEPALEEGFGQWVTTRLCEPLYDTLRNRIIRENGINTLCEMAVLLQKYYEFDDVEFGEIEPARFGASRAALGVYFRPILEDVQSRLVFRVQWFVEEHIVKYQPKFEDLKMLGHRKPKPQAPADLAEPPCSPASEIPPETPEGLPATGFTDLYPPLAQSMRLLSQIYQLVNSSIFDDLAHHVVHACMTVLREGAYDLALKTLGPLDALLYLMANYLILQKLLARFEIEHIQADTFIDFTGLGNVVDYVRGRSTDDRGLLALAKQSVPKVVRNMTDARKELAEALQLVGETFTQAFVSKKVAYPLEPPVVLATVVERVARFRDAIESEIPNLLTTMDLFIHDSKVTDYLVDGIQEAVLLRYSQFYREVVRLQEDAAPSDRLMLGEVMEVDTLVGLLGEVLGRMYRRRNDSILTTDMLSGDEGVYGSG